MNSQKPGLKECRNSAVSSACLRRDESHFPSVLSPQDVHLNMVGRVGREVELADTTNFITTWAICHSTSFHMKKIFKEHSENRLHNIINYFPRIQLRICCGLFGSDRSLRSHSVRLSVPSVTSLLEQSLSFWVREKFESNQAVREHSEH